MLKLPSVVLALKKFLLVLLCQIVQVLLKHCRKYQHFSRLNKLPLLLFLQLVKPSRSFLINVFGYWGKINILLMSNQDQLGQK